MDDAIVERSPEVLYVKQKMHETGIDMFFDIHGDEALPYNFVAGNEMLENFSEERRVKQQAFIDRYKNASPDFQDKYGYAASKYKEDMLTLASKYVGHHFGCLALTLEMPFKDNADLPDPTWAGTARAVRRWARRSCSLSCCRWTTTDRGRRDRAQVPVARRCVDGAGRAGVLRRAICRRTRSAWCACASRASVR
jgi:hypothetical protein